MPVAEVSFGSCTFKYILGHKHKAEVLLDLVLDILGEYPVDEELRKHIEITPDAQFLPDPFDSGEMCISCEHSKDNCHKNDSVCHYALMHIVDYYDMSKDKCNVWVRCKEFVKREKGK